MLDALTTLERAELAQDVAAADGNVRLLFRLACTAAMLGAPETRSAAVSVYQTVGCDAGLAGAILWPRFEQARGGPLLAVERAKEALAALQGRPAVKAPEAPRVVRGPPAEVDAGPLPEGFRILGLTWPEVLARGLDPAVMTARMLFAEAANAAKAGMLEEWQAKHPEANAG